MTLGGEWADSFSDHRVSTSKGIPTHTFTPNQAQSRFDELLGLTRQGPVRIIEQGNILGVLVSAQDYDAMRTFHADRARRQRDEAAASKARFRAPDNERPR